uniref:Uncharacterized protein n=1 Tax=Caenorhabditis japonica TaxID=281687 RepID=A0A8R1IPV7_CAEJA
MSLAAQLLLDSAERNAVDNDLLLLSRLSLNVSTSSGDGSVNGSLKESVPPFLHPTFNESLLYEFLETMEAQNER